MRMCLPATQVNLCSSREATSRARTSRRHSALPSDTARSAGLLAEARDHSTACQSRDALRRPLVREVRQCRRPLPRARSRHRIVGGRRPWMRFHPLESDTRLPNAKRKTLAQRRMRGPSLTPPETLVSDSFRRQPEARERPLAAVANLTGPWQTALRISTGQSWRGCSLGLADL